MIDPKVVINTLSVEELCEAAESHFRTIQDFVPHIGKPFSSFFEAPVILQNMGQLLAGLQLGKTMTVLEFAAGTCWFSRFLSQMQCQTISCDASASALNAGKRLFAEYPIIGKPISEPRFLPFDGHKIDLPSASVDRIVCHDGFHHVPNQEEILQEFGRILKLGGIAGFSEPGRLHSRSPQSQYEMQNYKILENDIVLPEIFSTAKRHGFTDLRVRVSSEMDLSFEEQQSFTAGMQNSVLDASILNNIRNIMSNRTLFFLHKGAHVSDSRSHVGLSHAMGRAKNWLGRLNALSVKAGEELSIPLKISNTGSARWLNENIDNIGVVFIGTHLYDDRHTLLNLDFARFALPAPVEPGAELSQTIKLRFSTPGTYIVSVDLVSEGICWFEIVGSTPLTLQIHVHE